MNIELKLKVEDLNARYAQAIDADNLEAWPCFFTDGGPNRAPPAENFGRGLPPGIISAPPGRGPAPRGPPAREPTVYEAQRYPPVIGPPLIAPAEGSAVRAQTS